MSLLIMNSLPERCRRRRHDVEDRESDEQSQQLTNTDEMVPRYQLPFGSNFECNSLLMVLRLPLIDSH